ncbi:MAG: hypothetical protein M1834_009407 [Cirrosporium novae-zelandiae]|nr:MAG: hypothetical protein M1834_009407 [Cirrosporium novae-zelandiae]
MTAEPLTMLAISYEGPFKVAVKEVPQPILEHPDDVIVKVTTAGMSIPESQSTLSTNQSSQPSAAQTSTSAEPGLTFGHENMGIVTTVGKGVTLLKEGDRVVMPFNVADGRCRNCEEGKTAFCTGVNPGFAGGAYGYVSMGPYRGGQAQYIRVPYADFNALKLPPGTAHEKSFALLADIFPTGWHGLTLAGFQPGETVAVFGAGPVGLMAAYSAVLRGASRIFVVDRVPERLAKAKQIGCDAIDFSKGDPVDEILRLNGGEVDRAIDAVGYQAQAPSTSTSPGKETESPHEKANTVLEWCIRIVRPTGGIGIPGLYVPSDPGASSSSSKQGLLTIPFGKLFEKGLSLGTGQCNVKAYNRYLRDLIIAGKADPSFVVSHEVGFEGVVGAYERFDRRVEGYTKVLLHPNGGF